MSFAAEFSELPGGRCYRLLYQQKALILSDFLGLLSKDGEFCDFYNQLLADAPWQAFFWEFPALSWDSLSAPVEFVLMDAPPLYQVRADSSAFDAHFEASPSETVLSFANLSGDAQLFVPRPLAESSAYGHLAQFVRQAPKQQQRALWALVGRELMSRLEEDARYLSTAGLGVPWLHLRLDRRPKYYRHQPYKSGQAH